MISMCFQGFHGQGFIIWRSCYYWLTVFTLDRGKKMTIRGGFCAALMEMLRSLRASLSDLLFHSCASFVFYVKLCNKLALFGRKQ